MPARVLTEFPEAKCGSGRTLKGQRLLDRVPLFPVLWIFLTRFVEDISDHLVEQVVGRSVLFPGAEL
jgi:hypothetical protein